MSHYQKRLSLNIKYHNYKMKYVTIRNAYYECYSSIDLALATHWSSYVLTCNLQSCVHFVREFQTHEALYQNTPSLYHR